MQLTNIPVNRAFASAYSTPKEFCVWYSSESILSSVFGLFHGLRINTFTLSAACISTYRSYSGPPVRGAGFHYFCAAHSGSIEHEKFFNLIVIPVEGF